LLCDGSEVRTAVLAQLVQTWVAMPRGVAFIDLDTLHSVYLQDHPEQASENLLIATPDATTIDDAVAYVISNPSADLGLVVFDSVTMFYHLFGGSARFGQLNQKLSVYFALFRRLARAMSVAALVTSFARPHRVAHAGGHEWVHAYSGGRILHRGCDVLLQVRDTSGGVEIRPLKHYDATLQGKQLRLAPARS
jgi:RecA/RadA recombinase